LKVAADGLATIREQGGGVLTIATLSFPLLFERMINHLAIISVTTEPKVAQPVSAEIPIKRASLRKIFDFEIIKWLRVRV